MAGMDVHPTAVLGAAPPAGPRYQPLGRAERLGWLTLAALVLFVPYLWVGRWMAGRTDVTLHQLPTFIDAWAPFWPSWTVIYLWMMPQAIAPASVITDRVVLLRSFAAYLTMYAVGMCFWVGYPVTVPRTPVPVEDLFTYGVAFMRWADPPVNCFPSMHVADATLAALVVWRHDRLVGRALLAATPLVWWSTITLDQHWFVDGLAGLLLAIAADRLWLARLPAERFRRLPRAWHLTWIGLFVAAFLAIASGWWLGWIPEAG